MRPAYNDIILSVEILLIKKGESNYETQTIAGSNFSKTC